MAAENLADVHNDEDIDGALPIIGMQSDISSEHASDANSDSSDDPFHLLECMILEAQESKSLKRKAYIVHDLVNDGSDDCGKTEPSSIQKTTAAKKKSTIPIKKPKTEIRFGGIPAGAGNALFQKVGGLGAASGQNKYNPASWVTKTSTAGMVVNPCSGFESCFSQCGRY
jgi:hypothetical protein